MHPVIASAGARAPMGMNCLQVAMGARARVLQPRACGLFDKRRHRIATCRVGGIREDVHGFERMLALAIPALEEAVPARSDQPVPIMLALPEPERPFGDAPAATRFLPSLAAR